VLRDFKFASWIVQVLNIFLMDLTFATANAMLIRGVGRSFASLRSAQAKVLGFLAEKETLIREIYHRSKNNMQVVTSILRIASGKLEDERSKAVLKDVINKIGSMSLVHQKLYESQDLSKIGMEAYVSELASLLLSSFGVGEGKVALDLEVEDLSMQIDAAIPCGLVINEIVTNSLKYAFPGDRRGRIAISMRETGNWVELRISDDGVGFPEGYDPEAIRKMGLGTVFTIVRHQMRGEIEFSTGRGVEYSIRFPREQYKARIGADE
jgi:two-component sensor histidine kinase